MLGTPVPWNTGTGVVHVMSVKEDIHIRVDEDVMGAVRAYAASHGISLAAAVSVLLRRALKGERQ